MRAIDLAVKDLIQLVRDWKAAAFLVVMPIIFTLMFGLAFGGAGGETDPRLPVGFVNQDGEHALSGGLWQLLNASAVVRPEVYEGGQMDEVEKRVKEENWAAAIVVPAGYGERTLAGEVVSLTVIVAPGSTAGSAARSEIAAVAGRLSGAAKIARLSAEAYAAQVGFADEAARQAFLMQALGDAIEAWQSPPLTVAVEQSGVTVARPEPPSSYVHTSPGTMVQFAIAGLIGTGEILVLERKSRALRRLLTTAISRLEILVGHYLAMFVMILLQLLLLAAFGQFVLGVDYLREPIAILLVMVTTALWTASLGLLIGALAQSEEQVIVFSLIPMFVLAGLGGAWIPLESTNETFRAVGHLTPTAWAMDGFKNIIVRGQGLDSVLLPAGVMLLYAVLFGALAAWRFRFE